MNYYDHYHLLKNLSPAKLQNITQVLGSYYRSRFLKAPLVSGLPFSISIEPTTSCNLRCPECPSGLRSFSRPIGRLSSHTFERIIEELYPTLVYLTFYFQGEPYLHPQFLEMVQYARKKNIYTGTSTNAHYLHDEKARQTVESGLNRLIISIDGTSQETYESYRIGGKLDKVIQGTENILKWKKKLKSKTPHTIFQFLVVRPNEHQIPEVKLLAKKLGVDEVKLKTAQIYDYEQGSDLIPLNSQYTRYKKNTQGTFEIKNPLLNHCWKMWHSCVFTWDGDVVPCCFDKDAQHKFGNIHQSSFQEIWQGEAYLQFRRSLLKSRKEIDICQNCTEGTKVWA
ncbi:MAG: SPASM domain-containing protein [Microscillaceae bacterium]|nr:SPASM domain-containing protein [Microscillaceae bacterium]